MSSFQPERPLPERIRNIDGRGCELGNLERLRVLAEIHRDEAEAVLTLSANVQCRTRITDFGNIHVM